MPQGFLGAIGVLWVLFLLYWAIAARQQKNTQQREDWKGRLVDTLPFMFVSFLLVGRRALPASLTTRLFPSSLALDASCFIVTALGLAFAVWARLHLGRDWAPTVVIKVDQALIRTGPYRWVRHPIYSGMLLALGATALAVGEGRAALAFALAFIGFLRRICAEEKCLAAIFPDYENYRRETVALIPFIF